MKKLVYDIGAHRGDDCYVYLQMGYRVLAVEANPSLVIELKKRFRKEIEMGDMIVLNYAVAEEDNQQADFFINEDSSKSSASKVAGNKSIKVDSRQLQTIMSEFGKPYYCKIDIEDGDLTALLSLDFLFPSYISVEVSGKSIRDIQQNEHYLFATINRLYNMGYKRFKLVDQENLFVLTSQSYYKKKKTLRGRVSLRIEKKLRISAGDRFRRQFNLPLESEISGYPSDQINAEWINYEQATRLLEYHFQEYCSVCENPDFIFWVDVHAAL